MCEEPEPGGHDHQFPPRFRREKALLIGSTKINNYQESEEFQKQIQRTYKFVDGLPTLTSSIIL
jgi:hypothetical protein